MLEKYMRMIFIKMNIISTEANEQSIFCYSTEKITAFDSIKNPKEKQLIPCDSSTAESGVFPLYQAD
jgi:hypothetical protein